MIRGLSQEATVAKIQCLGGEGYRMTVQILKNIETGRTSVIHWQIRSLRTVLHCSYDDIFMGPQVNGADTSGLLKKRFETNGKPSRNGNGHGKVTA